MVDLADVGSCNNGATMSSLQKCDALQCNDLLLRGCPSQRWQIAPPTSLEGAASNVL